MDEAAAIAWTGGGRVARQAPAHLEQRRRLIFPATFLTVTLFALNFLGDGLRDALDPKDRWAACVCRVGSLPEQLG